MAAAIVLAVALGVGAVVASSRDDGGETAADRSSEIRAEPGGRGDGSDRRATEVPADASSERTPRQVVALAAHRLQEAGSFTYEGTVRSAGPGRSRPGIWREGELTVEGEVVLPHSSREIAVDTSGHAVETVTKNFVVWGRTAEDVAHLPDSPLEIVREDAHKFPLASGAAVLPDMLIDLTDRTADGTDAQGRSRVRGTLSLGAVVSDAPTAFVDADVVLTVDEAGDPVRFELTTEGEDPPLVMALDLSRIGDPVVIDVPDGQPTSVTGDVSVDDVRAAGIDHPVELAEVPDGWMLSHIDLVEDWAGPGCAALELSYTDAEEVDTLDRRLDLTVMSAACDVPGRNMPDPVTLGSFTGTMSGDDSLFVADVSDGRTRVSVYSTLPVAEVSDLFRTLESFDPSTPPRPRSEG